LRRAQDFNAGGGDSEHYEEYMKRMNGQKAGGAEDNEMVKKAKAAKAR
jgi:hypothetical protein